MWPEVGERSALGLDAGDLHYRVGWSLRLGCGRVLCGWCWHVIRLHLCGWRPLGGGTGIDSTLQRFIGATRDRLPDPKALSIYCPCDEPLAAELGEEVRSRSLMRQAAWRPEKGRPA